MALQLSYQDPDTQAVYPNAYLRIDRITRNHLNEGGDTLTIGIYATQAAAQAGANPIKHINYVLTDTQALSIRAQELALHYGIVSADPQFSIALPV